MLTHRTGVLLLAAGLLLAAWPCRAGYDLVTSSVLGEVTDTDRVVGARIQSSGIIVLAANLDRKVPIRTTQGSGRGCLLFLTPDGRKSLGLARESDEIHDLALDGSDNIVIATAKGVTKLSPDGKRKLWSKSIGDCKRVDAGPQGYTAAIADGIVIFDPSGKQLGKASGKSFTEDICIEEKSQTVIFCGFRNAKAFDGKQSFPVQICYVRGLDYSGKVKWTNYDWSTDQDSERFLNKPTNNMADMRAYRCSVGEDGKLYVGFEAAGGNHAMRYHPQDIMKKVPLAGGDQYHQFHNSRAEHKTIVGKFEPGSGEYIIAQQFCARLGDGRANAVRVKAGEVTGDKQGRLYLGGASAYGLPLSFSPSDQGEYTGGGFLMVMSPDLSQRLYCTRLCAGKGETHAIGVRTIKGKPVVVWAGGGVLPSMHKKHPVQEKVASGEESKVGYFAVAGPSGTEGLLVGLSGSTALGGAPRRPVVTQPKVDPRRVALAKWDRRLVGLLQVRLAAGQKPEVELFKRSVKILSMDSRGVLQLESEGKTAPYTIQQFHLVDRARLAKAVIDQKNPEDCAMMAFYLLMAGKKDTAEQLLKLAGPHAAGVREVFK